MRKLITVLSAGLLVLIVAAPVAATWGPGCQDTKQYAVKFAVNDDGSGATDYECGNVWELDQAGVLDDDFRDSGGLYGFGSIENMNNKASWMKAWNQNNTYGMCITLYAEPNRQGRDLDFWIGPNDVKTWQLGVVEDVISSMYGWNPIAGQSGCNDNVW